MYRFLLSRQWVILTLVGLLMMPTMVRLGFWQLHRHERRVANNHLISDNLKAAPLPVESLTGPGTVVPKKDIYRTVTATGRYDTAHEVVARQRTAADGDSIGYHVITPLVMADGRAVLVNRGWIAAGGNLTKFPKVPAAPSGEVTVTGRLRPDETTGATGIRNKGGLPDRMIMLINSGLVAKDLPAGEEPVGGYMELSATSPKPTGHQPELIPEPDHSSIGMHMGYAIQWWLFTAMVPVGWVILVRRERKERLAAAQAAQAAAAGPGEGPDGDSAGGPADGESPGQAVAAVAAP
ncbi:SURF1 family protein [Streptomyces sp. NPDC046977]|uniref:SURF1 family cytochrome oxidase biogenesis protein n=1 Tax=Streptomyces sp. NPDC046977 TaxID=3154703 RepID=UPI0033FF53A2